MIVASAAVARNNFVEVLMTYSFVWILALYHHSPDDGKGFGYIHPNNAFVFGIGRTHK